MQALQAKRLSFLGPYHQLAVLALLMLVLLSLSRLALFGWQFDRVSAAGPMLTMLLQGVRADAIFVGLWLVLPVLLAPFLARARYFATWQGLCRLWALLGLLLVLFLEVSTPQFILQYDVRPNRLFIEYLKYPKEVFSMLWQGYRIMLLAGIASTVLLVSGFYLLLRRFSATAQPWSTRRLLLSWPLVVLLLFCAIRSTTEHRPANPALFAITGDPLVNSLIISSPYSVLYSLYSLRHEASASDVYGNIDTDEMLKTALDWPWLKQAQFVSAELPTLNTRKAIARRSKPLNLVIVLEESLGATFVESLGGVAVTPELEKLKHDGWWFEQMYATGTRSVRGIEAVVSGFMPTPAQSVVKLSLAQQHFFTLGGALSDVGFHSSFIYG